MTTKKELEQRLQVFSAAGNRMLWKIEQFRKFLKEEYPNYEPLNETFIEIFGKQKGES